MIRYTRKAKKLWIVENTMESEEICKIMHAIFQPTEQPRFPEMSQILTPFSELSENKETRYIYVGSEKIPFKERLPEYQEILIHEFLMNGTILLESYN
jgi:hypothetical protein